MTISHLSKSYGKHSVFQDRTFTIEEGKINVLVGPSGSGKTTLLRIICGLEQPDSGDLSALRGKRFSMAFQEDRLCKNLSASANVRLVSGPETADRILTELGLGDSLKQPVKYLSGGMQRRVALARALAAQSDILLLDEPFTGLDDETKEEVIRLFLELAQGKTTILVTHDTREVALMGDVRMIRL
ncbi:MAG: ATP-binding cassette domain-containing protein [Sphaerochaetaceae bacterium]|nr:ATP-binding cassette domain-containing protein [Spirochaetales bacterium]MDY5498906.1 ATP-binding cassette domain-containing protein [Sphaerochaetaceae bacterium]